MWRTRDRRSKSVSVGPGAVREELRTNPSLTRKEYMMGHAGMTAPGRSYCHAHTLELAREYINAVPDLTIDDAERLRAENCGMKREMLKAGREGAARMAELEGIVASFSHLADGPGRAARAAKPAVCPVCNRDYGEHAAPELATCGQKVIAGDRGA